MTWLTESAHTCPIQRQLDTEERLLWFTKQCHTLIEKRDKEIGRLVKQTRALREQNVMLKARLDALTEPDSWKPPPDLLEIARVVEWAVRRIHELETVIFQP